MSRPHIDSYAFGYIIIDGETYEADLILLPDRIVEGWWRDEGHLLQTADLENVFDAEPDLLVVGQGAYGRMRIADQVRRAAKEANIELVALPTDEAVERYNALPEDQRAVAALHLTC